MKTWHNVVLLAAVCAGGLFAGALAAKARAHEGPSATQGDLGGGVIGTAPGPQSNRGVKKPVRTPEFRWSDLQSTNLTRYTQNLRAFGCPEEIVSAVIHPEITNLFIRKYSAVKDAMEDARHPQLRNARLEARKKQDAAEFEEIAYAKLNLARPASEHFTGAEEARIAEARRMFPVVEGDSEELTLTNETNMQARIDYLVDHLTKEKLQTYALEREPIGTRIRSLLEGMDPARDELLAAAALAEEKGADLNREDLQKVLSPERHVLFQDLRIPALRNLVMFARLYQLPNETRRQLIELRRSYRGAPGEGYEEKAAAILKNPELTRRLVQNGGV